MAGSRVTRGALQTGKVRNTLHISAQHNFGAAGSRVSTNAARCRKRGKHLDSGLHVQVREFDSSSVHVRQLGNAWQQKVAVHLLASIYVHDLDIPPS